MRDYGTGSWDGGDPDCEHRVRPKNSGIATSTLLGGHATVGHQREGYAGTCRRCGAVRVDRQIGIEPTLAEYLDRIVAVFREVRRVLRDDGTLWLNCGDTLAAGGRGSSEHHRRMMGAKTAVAQVLGRKSAPPAFKPKDLIGLPWRVAFALQADGWWLRSDIVWAKPSPVPESVTDRPTRAHEFVFVLAKRARYFFDAVAIAEPLATASLKRINQPGFHHQSGGPKDYGLFGDLDRSARGALEHFAAKHRRTPAAWNVNHDLPDDLGRYSQRDHGRTQSEIAGEALAGRNARDVWTIAAEPFNGAHFATFPTALAERCIKAGTSEKGVCSACGAPWRRLVKRRLLHTDGFPSRGWHPERDAANCYQLDAGSNRRRDAAYQTTTVDWEPTCKCTDAGPPVSAVVLDPFSGSGRTLVAALRLGRRAIGIDLDPRAEEMARQQIESDELAMAMRLL